MARLCPSGACAGSSGGQSSDKVSGRHFRNINGPPTSFQCGVIVLRGLSFPAKLAKGWKFLLPRSKHAGRASSAYLVAPHILPIQ